MSYLNLIMRKFFSIYLKVIVFVILSLVKVDYSYANTKLDSLLIVLDSQIDKKTEYTVEKELNISQLKKKSSTVTSLEEQFILLKEIFDEYKVFICDSAYHYSVSSLTLAEANNNIFWINESKLQLASILTISGMYAESVELMQSIDTKSLNKAQTKDYYGNYYRVYNEWAEYSEYDYSTHYKEIAQRYRELFLKELEPETFDYALEYSWKYIDAREYIKAKETLLEYLPKIEDNSSREYAILTSTIAIVYWYLENIEVHKEYLALSAIADIKASVKENTALRSLANLLFDEGGELKRASRYIENSMDDANFYNARLRSIQIAKLYPLIQNAYNIEKDQQQKKLKSMLWIISTLAVLLVLTVLYIIRQFKKLADSQKQIIEINNQLKNNNNILEEANTIKEEYLGRFLNLCSVYIDKMEKHHRLLNKRAKDGNLDELFKMLKSKQFIDDELADFYTEFDSAFLSIFPNFVQQFNDLLIPEEKITPKSGERLTTELRIFALIRLGITDSQKIAEFLRYSITTIYNYRSRYRNKSIVNREEFENEIMKISSY